MVPLDMCENVKKMSIIFCLSYKSEVRRALELALSGVVLVVKINCVFDVLLCMSCCISCTHVDWHQGHVKILYVDERVACIFCKGPPPIKEGRGNWCLLPFVTSETLCALLCEECGDLS